MHHWHFCPIGLFITAGQVSDYTGAAALLDSFPRPDGCWPTVAMMTVGLVTLRATIRQVPNGISLRHRSRGNRYLLALTNES